MSKELVSIIIPTYNESRNIKRCLKAIKLQKYKNIEVIMIDDASFDKTIDLAHRVAQKIGLKIKIIKQETHQERGVIRNLAVRKARGLFLLFIDADMELSPEVVNSCINICKQDLGIKAVIIPEESIGTGYWANCRTLEKRCYLGDDSIEAARFFEHKAFKSVGGWSEGMIAGEDWDLSQRFRKKYKIGRIDDLIFHHEGRLSIFRAIYKKYYYTINAKAYLSENKQSVKSVILFVLRPAFFRNWKLFLLNPVIGIGVVILKFSELMAGLAGFFVLYFGNRR